MSRAVWPHVAAACAVATLAALVALALRLEARTASGGDVLTCAIDDDVSSVHVGVADASVSDAGVWRLDVGDGRTIHYAQRPGESCELEASTSATAETFPSASTASPTVSA